MGNDKFCANEACHPGLYMYYWDYYSGALSFYVKYLKFIWRFGTLDFNLGSPIFKSFAETRLHDRVPG